VKEAFETGRGRIVIRGKAEIETDKTHDQIIITEIPYMVNKADLIKHIADLVTDKKIEGISNINDESDRQGNAYRDRYKTRCQCQCCVKQTL